jgi:hypothetical protein
MPDENGGGIDLDFLVENATPVADPIAPQPDPEMPIISEEEAAERESFVQRQLHMIAGGKREPKAPRNRKVKAPAAPVDAPAMPRKGTLAKSFTQMYVSIGTFLLPFDAACGGAVINAAPKCGEALEELARTNPAIRKALLAMLETSVWSQVILAHAPIMLAIAIHHVPAVRNNLSGMAAAVVGQAMQPEDANPNV